MGEICKSEQVELQENGIIRNQDGIIIGRIVTNEDEQTQKYILNEMKEALKYYKNSDNWTITDNGRGYEMYYIDDSDHLFVMGRGWSGGKRAKEALDNDR